MSRLPWFAVLCIGYLLGLGASMVMDLSLRDELMRIKRDEWQCIEYMPASAKCAVYKRIEHASDTRH